jgi:hypothetical protein
VNVGDLILIEMFRKSCLVFNKTEFYQLEWAYKFAIFKEDDKLVRFLLLLQLWVQWKDDYESQNQSDDEND